VHRAESIMVAVLAKIANLTTTGTNVERSRVYPNNALPALTLEQGEDAVELQSMAFVDRQLDVRVIAHVKKNTDFDTQLNQIREEVYIALKADYTQGLDFILDTVAVGDGEPEFSGEADKVIGRQVMNFLIKYRHSLTNPGA